VRVFSAQHSPDGRRILTTNQLGESQLWDAATGDPVGPAVKVVGGSDQAVRTVTFSPDGRWAAVKIPTTATLLDGRTGAEVGRRIAAGGSQARFSADGNRLATAGPDGIARVWAVPGGAAVTEPLRQAAAAALPEFSPDGLFLKTEDTAVRVWAVPPPLPRDAPPPDWLLDLATLCAGQVVDAAGRLVPAMEVVRRVEELRHQIATLPADAPLAAWGRWLLDDRPDRPIAPGFTITPAEARRLEAGDTLPSK
jgi:hypothetical protein